MLILRESSREYPLHCDFPVFSKAQLRSLGEKTTARRPSISAPSKAGFVLVSENVPSRLFVRSVTESILKPNIGLVQISWSEGIEIIGLSPRMAVISLRNAFVNSSEAQIESAKINPPYSRC